MTQLTPPTRDDIQGILLSGFGHLPYTYYLLLTVTDAVAAKAWLKRTLPAVTTAQRWPKDASGKTIKPDLTLNLALTHSGLGVLWLVEKALTTFPREFIEGMAEPKRAEILGDTGASAPSEWEFGGDRGAPIHLMVMLHGHSLEQLRNYAQTLLPEGSGLAMVAAEEGFRLPSKKEHFGFNDSVSQPEIKGLETPGSSPSQVVATGEFLLGYPDGYGIFALTPVLPAADDPTNLLPSFPGTELPGYKNFGHNGSFMVYRKLSQDVAKFWQYIDSQTRDPEGQPDPQAMTLIASKFVGRWPSGAPLTLTPDRDRPELADQNEFLYLPTDAKGLGCPMGAHIRRTNPRDSLLDAPGPGSLMTSSRHRILRRGSLYGPPLFPLDALDQGQLPVDIQDDGQDRGLHFFCFNADIGRQFEFVQQTWANNPRFDGLYDNKDPIIGDNDGTGTMAMPRCPVRQRALNLPRFVDMEGGGYFFMPSLSALRFLTT
jgi:Dyp-type peroxidase family